MSYVKKIVKKIIYGNRADSSSYVSFLRNAGCSIGDKTVIYDPPSTFIDVTRPWLINIGEGVKIAKRGNYIEGVAKLK
ncbi:hypothetical protein ACT7DB_31655 [Bacillus cereus]